MKIYIKYFFYWTISTILIYILIASAMMYSRSTTLQGVRVWDVKIFKEYLILEKNNPKKIENFITLTQVLGLKKSKKVFIPTAIITNDNCFENTYKEKVLCKYENIHILKKELSDKKPINYYDTPIYRINNEISLIVHIIDENMYIISEAGQYLKDDISLYKFINTEWYKHFLTFDKGKDGQKGIVRMYEKTKETLFIIFFFSFCFFLIFLIYQIKINNTYQKYKKDLNKSNDKLHKISEQFSDLNYEKKILEEKNKEIHSLIDKLQNNKSKDIQEKLNKLLKEEENITNIKEEIKTTLSELSIEKEKLEKENELLSKALIKKSLKISEDAKDVELTESLEKINQLTLLWSKDSEWNLRKDIETMLTGNSTSLPFTLSIAFILFENQFIDYKLQDYYSRNELFNISLVDRINVLVEKLDFDDNLREKLHNIRRSRNDWFHYGKKPSQEIIDDLFLILNYEKISTDSII